MKKYCGLVIKKLVAIGSKNEHEAVILKTKDQEFILRRVGGNAFQDSQLDDLVDQRIECEGEISKEHPTLLIISSWNLIN